MTLPLGSIYTWCYCCCNGSGNPRLSTTKAIMKPAREAWEDTKRTWAKSTGRRDYIDREDGERGEDMSRPGQRQQTRSTRGTIQPVFFVKSQPWFATREYHGTQPCHEEFLTFIKTPSPSGRGGYKCLPTAQSWQSLIWLCSTKPNKNSISIPSRSRGDYF